MEKWKDVKGYEGLYQVSTLGRVRSFYTHNGSGQRILHSQKRSHGYLGVTLVKDGVPSCRNIHRLVAEAFIDNPCNYEQINHKDEDKTNNRVENLEWCTAKYNSNYGTGAQRSAESRKKLPQLKRKVLCVETGEVFDSLTSVKEFTRVNGVWRALNGRNKTCGGYHWRYV